ncbi:LLM class flavin-dependent oxidoreductase [Streptomyces sp. SCL15-4]|uniref:LLM class flavin-dependent oxidoreductase n=1 Tax=Streptomyces sp. SCL15-4 TaxID=2967221 RepID=UPI002966BFEC|nr:LLM class flavin-dependent oxidoreductase [Streptomyces sp. SCL15-4]
MKFGIFFELSVPQPLGRADEIQAYQDALEQSRLADELGFTTAWAVEHHFLQEYSHCSAPEVFLTAVAMSTSRLRVGHGGVVCVPQINHPVRVAERAAALDILSGGRLDVGTARASTITELGGFMADPDSTKMSWDEYIDVLPRMWTEEHVRYDGTTFTLPERPVVPKPVQDPHPPLWVTVTSPGTERDAADRGIGCLGVAAASFKEQERRTGEYRKRIQQCDPAGRAVNDQVATMNYLFCHEDDATAARIGGAMFDAFGMLNSQLLWAREVYPTPAYRSLGNLAPGGVDRVRDDSPAARRPVPEGVAIGDPDRIVKAVKIWESMGVDAINFLLNTANLVPQDQVLASMRLFAAEVMPHFAEGGS